MLSALLLYLALGSGVATLAEGAPHRYWPRFPRPTVILTVREVRTPDEAFVLQSAAGLAAKAALEGRNREMVWYPIGHPAYERWHADLMRQVKPREVVLDDVWGIVERLRKRGIVRGYVLFKKDAHDRALHERGDYDPSANVATVMASRMHGILVSEEARAQAEAAGLRMLADARGVSEDECFSRYGATTSRTVLAVLDPKAAHCRAEAIALNAFVLATWGPALDRALARLEPDSPILGWGLGDEFRNTEPVSRWAAWQSATNWCLNLPVLSTEEVGKTIPAGSVRQRRVPSLWDLNWEDGVHWASFLMTDGDNVQWLMGDFQFGAEKAWWNSPARGKFAMGWGACIADLMQLCPYAWLNLVKTASPSDDLVLMGGGYYYPDLFGKERTGVDAMRVHARRIRGYMRLAGARVLHMNAAKWDSPEAIRAYTTFAEEIPELEGIMMVQYAPYTAGKGRVIWVKRRDGSHLPVVAARFAIWAHSRFPNDGPPRRVAKMLSAMPTHDPADRAAATPRPSDVPDFSWVTVHCWSFFREAGDNEADDAEEVDQARWRDLGAKRGLEPVEWCVRRLEPHVRVVTPAEMTMLLSLKHNSAEALTRALDELQRVAASASPARRKAAAQHIERARKQIAAGEFREAFAAGKRASVLLKAPVKR